MKKNEKKDILKGEKKKRIKLKKKTIIALVIFALAVILVVLYFVNRNLVKHQPEINIDESQTEEVTQEKDPKLEEIQSLYNENNDLVGWIQIDGTKIDYPVMYTKDQDYYLRRDFYKKSSTAGTLYVDKHNTMNPRDINIIIHGHNMSNGTMFADLLNYKQQSYYEEHKKITYYTLEAKEEYEIIAVFLSKVYNVTDNVFKYYKFYGEQTEDTYNDYIKNIKKLARYDIATTATYPEKLITLSTCEYSQEDGRLVVVAKQIS